MNISKEQIEALGQTALAEILTKEVIKKAKKDDKEASEIAAKDIIRQKCQAEIIEKDVFFLRKTSQYTYKTEEKRRVFFHLDKLGQQMDDVNYDGRDIFLDVIKKLGRKKFDIGFSVGYMDSDSINDGDAIDDDLMKIDFEDTTPRDPIFDHVFYSVGGHDEKQTEELKKALLHRYLSSLYRLPNNKPPIPVIIGKGGTGKNLIMETVIKTIFNSGANKWTNTATTRDIEGQWTTYLENKLILAIDEFNPKSMHDVTNILKTLTNNNIFANSKNKDQGEKENAAWIWILTNSETGGVKLANSGQNAEDRRFLILIMKQSLIDYLYSVGYTKQSMDDALSKLEDPLEVNRFMRDLWIQYHDELYVNNKLIRMNAYHGPDYQSLVKIQEDDWKTHLREWLPENLSEQKRFVTQLEVWDAIKKAVAMNEFKFNDIKRNTFFARLKNFIDDDNEIKSKYKFVTDSTIKGVKIKKSIYLLDNTTSQQDPNQVLMNEQTVVDEDAKNVCANKHIEKALESIKKQSISKDFKME